MKPPKTNNKQAVKAWEEFQARCQKGQTARLKVIQEHADKRKETKKKCARHK